MQDSVAAKKYARALFAEAQKANQLLACQQGLDQLALVSRSKGSLREVLQHPAISAAEKKNIIHAALGEYATPLLERFVQLLVAKHRLDLLTMIRQQFQEEMDRFQQVELVKVRTALPVSEAQRNVLQEKLEKWMGTKVRMEVQEDASLLGGLVIQSRNFLVDQSLRGQLKRLQKQLVS